MKIGVQARACKISMGGWFGGGNKMPDMAATVASPVQEAQTQAAKVDPGIDPATGARRKVKKGMPTQTKFGGLLGDTGAADLSKIATKTLLGG